jgi:hypothetical protein
MAQGNPRSPAAAIEVGLVPKETRWPSTLA